MEEPHWTSLRQARVAVWSSGTHPSTADGMKGGLWSTKGSGTPVTLVTTVMTDERFQILPLWPLELMGEYLEAATSVEPLVGRGVGGFTVVFPCWGTLERHLSAWRQVDPSAVLVVF